MNPDSDGDGFSDSVEVLSGSDPNDPLSQPVPSVPSLPTTGLGVLVLALLASGSRLLRARARSSRE